MYNSELNILKNFIDMMPKTYRARNDNASIVRDILLNRTCEAGRSSCIAKCQKLGIDPYGHTLEQEAANERT